MRSLKTNSARGPLAQVFIGDEWHVHGPIDLTQDRKFLTWKRGQVKKVGHQQKNAPTLLLERFTQLAEEGSEGGGRDVLQFARKYGVLYLCRRHDLPSSHRALTKPSNAELNLGGLFARCGLRVTSDGFYAESIAMWRGYAKQARAILNVTVALKNGKAGDNEDWEMLAKQVGSVVDEKDDKGEITTIIVLPTGEWERRIVLSNAVNHWLSPGQVRPVFYLTEDGPLIQIGNRTVFGALGLQLMLAVSQTQGLASCTSCGIFYTPSRKPNPNRNSYCPTCGLSAAQRNASEKYRNNKKKGLS